jgi:hypothetical protein
MQSCQAIPREVAVLCLELFSIPEPERLLTKLKDDHILLTAKILAVSSAFVALISPRAYRDEINIEQALNQLLQEAGSKYERHVVAQ